MPKSYAKVKGRNDKIQFIGIPRHCAEHKNFYSLGAHALKLLIDLLFQYRGFNNGAMAATWTEMEKRGWKSRDTLRSALFELEIKGWIVVTRRGGRNSANLYAVTFRPINDCNGKLDVPAGPPPGFWKDGHNPWMQERHPKNPARIADTLAGAIEHGGRANVGTPNGSTSIN